MPKHSNTPERLLYAVEESEVRSIYSKSHLLALQYDTDLYRLLGFVKLSRIIEDFVSIEGNTNPLPYEAVEASFSDSSIAVNRS